MTKRAALRILASTLLTTSLCIVPLRGAAQPPAYDIGDRRNEDKSAWPFLRNRVRVTALIGTGATNADNYLILGAGVGYFVLDGLEIGIDYDAWVFGDPVMHRLSPEARYVFHFVEYVKPYVGIFYRHTFVASYDDFDNVGARGGILFAPKSGRVFVGGGAVYERTLNCHEGILVDCDAVYPEIFAGISF